MTKSKTSTIAIVVLSVLLAAALAATIVLAAFSASQKATTTITFGNGVTLAVEGITGTDNANWHVTIGSTNQTNSTYTVTGGEDVILDAISATVSGSAAYIAVKPVVTYEDGAQTVTIPTAITTAVDGKTGWVRTNAIVNVDTKTTLIEAFTLYDADATNAGDYAGRSYTCTVYIAAATDLAGLNAEIDKIEA